LRKQLGQEETGHEGVENVSARKTVTVFVVVVDESEKAMIVVVVGFDLRSDDTVGKDFPDERSNESRNNLSHQQRNGVVGVPSKSDR